MEFSCHSEYLPLASVYIKSALDAFIDSHKLDSEWRKLNYISPPNLSVAKKEYATFEGLLKNTGTTISYFPKDDKTTLDSIYCRDASIATDHGVIICNMGKEQRKTEPETQKAIFEANGVSLLGAIKAPGTLEGGDVAWLNENTMAVALSYRTNEEGIRQLKRLLAPYGIKIIVVDLPHYKGVDDVFHLMSVLSPVDKDLAVVYSPLTPIGFRNRLLQMGFKLVEVPKEEFESMGCNVLAVAPRKCMMVNGNPKTKEALEKSGCEVTIYEGQEISLKGGGGPTCLTRPLWRVK